MNLKEDQIKLLIQELKLIHRAGEILSKSYASCVEIGIKEDFSYEELTKYEAFCGRFSRLVALLIRRVFRLIDEINLVPEGTVRDSIYRAEKNNVIESATSLIEMNRVCSQLAHEYVIDKLGELFSHILRLTPTLLDCITKTERYCFSTFGI